MKIKELRLNNLVRLEDKEVYKIDSFHDLEEISYLFPDTKYCTGVVLNKHNVLEYFENVEDLGTKIESNEEGIYTEKYHLLNFKNVVDGTSDLRIRFYEDGYNELWIDSDEKVHIAKLTEIHHLQNMFFMITGFDLISRL